MLSIFNRNNNNNPLSNGKLTQAQLYEKLDRYYENNGLYEEEQQYTYTAGIFLEPIKGLRTVVNRSVEFYVSKILQNPRVSTDNEQIKTAIEQVWKWSNFYSQKALAIRSLALYGDLFLKVMGNQDKVWFEIIETKYVTKFETDKRGYITEIRIDIPIVEDEKQLTYTEYWNKEYYAIWRHTLGVDTKLDQLSDPVEYLGLAELGIDFVPFVNIQFKSTGNERGDSCVKHALDKIDEGNRQSTRLAQMLFRYNKPIWAVSSNSVDKNGKPLPPPKFNGEDDLTIKDSSIISLPGMSTLNSLIPDIKYADALAVLNAMMDEIKEDLPELNYYSMKDSSLSGKAIKLLLAGALDRATEAQNNLISGIIRLDEMALSIGKFFNLFSGIGDYQNGDFEHNVTSDEFFPADNNEKSLTVKLFRDSGLAIKTSMRLAGFSQEDIDLALLEAEEERTRNEQGLANSLTQFNQQ